MTTMSRMIQPMMLEGVDLFRGLDDQQLEWVSQHMYCKVFQPGAILMSAEQPGEVVYVILAGTLKIHIEQADGRDVILAILGPGEIAGEMSLIDSSGRSASVITLEESILLWMGAAHFQECIRRCPQVAINLVRVLSGRVRLANELIQALASLDVHGRVARQLLAFAEKYGKPDENGNTLIPMRLTQGDLADLVGASRKRVNQVMVTFKQQHYISIDAANHVILHDRDTLARFCR